MIDHLKRKTLKTLVVGTSGALVPVIAGTAAAGCLNHDQPVTATPDTNDARQDHATRHGLELEFEAIPNSDSVWVRFSNVTDKPVTVRHVNPGVVEFGGQRFDVNGIFDGKKSIYEGKSLTINPDESYSYIVAPLTTNSDIVAMPDTRVSPFTATVASVEGPINTAGVLTPRMVLA